MESFFYSMIPHLTNLLYFDIRKAAIDLNQNLQLTFNLRVASRISNVTFKTEKKSWITLTFAQRMYFGKIHLIFFFRFLILIFPSPNSNICDSWQTIFPRALPCPYFGKMERVSYISRWQRFHGKKKMSPFSAKDWVFFPQMSWTSHLIFASFIENLGLFYSLSF